MKYYLSILLCVIFFSGCSKEDDAPLEAYNAEAFAFDIGGSWEVNASTRVKGFRQIQENDIYNISLAYEIDVITPSGDTLKSMITRIEDKTSAERLSDIPLEIQFEMDSSYSAGQYVLIFRVNEPETGNHANSAAAFEL